MTKTESGSGVFIVRKGEFGYFRDTNGKEIEVNILLYSHLDLVLEAFSVQLRS